MMEPLEILIVGCSVAGPTLASFLLLSSLPAAQKPRITILERASAIRMEGQNIDVRGAGITIIRKLGLETAVRAATTGEVGVQIVDKNNYVWAYNEADQTGKVQTPTGEIEILRGHLANILYRKAKQISEEVQREGGAGVDFIFGDYLDDLEQDAGKVHVHFAKSGKRRSFDLVVGADGLQSKTRSLTWGANGDKERVKRLGMYGAFFSMPRGPTDTSWRRWFHAPGRRGIMVRPDQQRGLTTVFMTVINEKDERLPEAALKGRQGVETQKELMAEYFRDAGWESERVIQGMTTTNDFYYDMVGQVKMDKWNNGRVVLLGDAGYCASPLSGMGTTLALQGAYNLAGLLMQHKGDHVTAFVEWEKLMRPLVEKAQKLAPGMPYLMNPETERGIWILHATIGFLFWTRIFAVLGYLFGRFIGPPANYIPVADYGFRQLLAEETIG